MTKPSLDFATFILRKYLKFSRSFAWNCLARYCFCCYVSFFSHYLW